MSVQPSRGRATILVISLAALLAACSGSAAGTPSGTAAPGSGPSAAAMPASGAVAGATAAGAPAPGGDAGAPCALVSSDAVATATGFTVARSSGAGGICTYQNADSSKYLTVQVYASKADMALMLEAEPSGEHVAGLGDDAFWSSMGGLLFVRKGDHGVAFLDPDLGAGSLTDTTGRDALVTLARTAMPQL